MISAQAAAAMTTEYLQVALVSGKTADIAITTQTCLEVVKQLAEDALQTRKGTLRNSHGQLVDTRQTVAQAGLKPGDVLTLLVRQTRVAAAYRGRSSFSAILGDGCVVTWGHPDDGGDSGKVQERLKNVQHIQATERAFAAVLDN